MSIDHRDRLASLTRELDEAGALPPAWRDAFGRVPRHVFIPDRVWREVGNDFAPLAREENPDDWWDAVYGDCYIVTQVDDGRRPEPGQVGDLPTSSASMPSLVLWMLDVADIGDDHRVLEIGTGTGYSAALLAARLGNGHVVSVEVDAALAEQASRALAAAGFRPLVVAADGTCGYPLGAPYDRVIATCSVQRVPYPWVEQTRPGGLVITPWGTPYHNGALLRLEVNRDSTATGRFVGSLAFMWLRSHRVAGGRLSDHVHDEQWAERRHTSTNPRRVWGDEHVEFAIGTRVPSCQYRVFHGQEEEADEFTLWLIDADTGSWASVDYTPGADAFPVEQHGPRNLWDEVEAAHRWWTQAGQPHRERFGLTITPDHHTVWLDHPDGPSWNLPE